MMPYDSKRLNQLLDLGGSSQMDIASNGHCIHSSVGFRGGFSPWRYRYRVPCSSTTATLFVALDNLVSGLTFFIFSIMSKCVSHKEVSEIYPSLHLDAVLLFPDGQRSCT